MIGKIGEKFQISSTKFQRKAEDKAKAETIENESQLLTLFVFGLLTK